MGSHVLVPADGSESSWEALEYALTELPADRITVLNVINPVGAGLTTGSFDEAGDLEEGWLERARERAE